MTIAGDGERFMGVGSEPDVHAEPKSSGGKAALPCDPPRRRFVHRKLAALRARSTEITDGPVALPYGACEERATAPLDLDVPSLHRGARCA
jgi:hypothetical protein